MDIQFDCTLCGQCCHNLKLTLTVAEAMRWLEDGNQVQVLTEAIPWPDEPAADDLPALYKGERSFPVLSGALPSRVVVLLAAAFDGPCPNLLPDMRCGIYERRPGICRTYPAESNPFIPIVPSNKRCPPEAWAPGGSSFADAGNLVDAELRDTIAKTNSEAVDSVGTRQRLCAILGLDAAALINEGFVVYSLEPALLLEALQLAEQGTETAAAAASWVYVSNRSQTIDVLASAGAHGLVAQEVEGLPFEYVGYHSPSA